MMLTSLSELKAMRNGGRKVVGCSEHLCRQKKPTESAMKAWSEHVSAEEDKRRRCRVTGCSQRLHPPMMTAKKCHRRRRILPDDKIADLNNRMYYGPIERDCILAKKSRITEKKNAPSRSGIYFSEGQAKECASRLYAKASAERIEHHAMLLSKYLTPRQPARKLTPAEMIESNKRLYTSAIAETVRVMDKGVAIHCPPLKSKLALTADQWNDTIGRLYPATAR
eukprot:TRINITY_DN22438_c0_g1_i1.p1 TRINITY_DN22438_c0_g1~~TRINITY_DN22438_c0_g1_i1.p1  ORF type:complete len:224 (+),score=25.52 TRINITY_DN22438_c0_g1_i1:44-715(+)